MKTRQERLLGLQKAYSDWEVTIPNTATYTDAGGYKDVDDTNLLDKFLDLGEGILGTQTDEVSGIQNQQFEVSELKI